VVLEAFSRLPADRNVGLNPRLDQELIAGIRALGTLCPVALRASLGEAKVRLGSRRTLEAVEAKLAQVPVMVMADQQGEVDRIVAQ
jgi:hypothetical protein